MWAWRSERLQDLVLALVMAAIGVASVFTVPPSVAYQYPPPSVWLVVLALIGTLPLAVRRIWPLTALLVCLAAGTTIMTLRWNEGVVPFAVVIALYSVAVHRPLRVASAGLVATLGSFTLLAMLGAPHFDSIWATWEVLIFLVPWAIGLGVRHQARLRQQALTQALAAERELAVARERATTAERLRIARELHDVVAHSLSVVAVQAGVARYLLEEAPDRVAPALAAIEDANRSALDDLRRMLGTLRAVDGHPEQSAQLRPAPGLPELRDLAELHQRDGGPVDLVVDPAVAELPASLSLTVHRIVQESLTNTRKHSPDSAVHISVTKDADTVRVQIENDAPTTPGHSSGSGMGLIGMRERVALFGGTLDVGPTADGGFRVLALLPAARHQVAS